jgi:MtfA peptidase
MLRFFRDRRRKKLLAQPMPAGWGKILDRNLPHAELLSDDEWEELLRHTRVLHAEKRFEGCGGLEVTEEMRVTICGWGALLLLGRDTQYYPHLETVLVYPSSFVVPVQQQLDAAPGAQIRYDEVRLGESLGEGGPGSIVLAWDEVLKAAGDWSDGVNVAIHEFTHQLDEEDGALNGVPLIRDKKLRERWIRIMQSEFGKLERDDKRFDSGKLEQEPLLDPYALTSTTEFFSVAMETFFELPIDLEAEHPKLYGVMRDWLGQDPAERWRRAEKKSRSTQK